MHISLRVPVLLAAAVVSASTLVGLERALPAGGASPQGAGRATGPAAVPITPLPETARWRTVFTGTMSGIEGLTGDDHGNLYVAERSATGDCPVWRISVATGATTQVGFQPAPCTPSGLAYGPDGRLYITGGDAPALDQIDVLRPGTADTEATVFATGVPQANGLAFDPHGNLWATDGQNAEGIVYRVGPDGGAGTEVFRIPTPANSIGVGRQNATLQGTSPNTASPQAIVSNGIVFTSNGDMIVSDTSRGALWKVRLDRSGNLASATGCDSTYPADTLCLNDVLVQSPYLVGVDGITRDTADRIWADANEREAVIVVSPDGQPTELFRNPVDPSTGRRNAGPLETPTSPVLSGHTLCTTNSDTNRADNAPNTAGEVAGTGKVSCLDVPVPAHGVPAR